MQKLVDFLGCFARPCGLYSFYLTSLIFAIGLISGADVDAVAIGAVLVPLSGVGGTYVWKRTEEKMEGKQ